MISIVIVNWNSGPFLERCVRSLSGNAAGSEIVIIDNASDDESLEFTKKEGEGLRVLRHRSNRGFAAASNAGWRVSSGDRILFLNPDCEALPGSVQFLDSTLSGDDALWAAGGRLIGTSGASQPNFNVRPFPTIVSVAAEMLMLDEIWPANPWSGAARFNLDKECDIEQPAAACLMVLRDALEAVDGFDEDFHPAWFEDVDLCRRIHKEGGRIRFQPNARFLHHGGYSLEKMTRQQFLEIFHRNQILYFRKHCGPRSAARVRRLVSAGLRIRAAASLVFPLVRGESRAASARTFWRAARQISRSAGERR